MQQPPYQFGAGRRYGNWGTGTDIRSMGLGKQVVMFNPNTNVVVARIGVETSIQFDYNDWFKMINAAIKNPEDVGNPDDWLISIA